MTSRFAAIAALTICLFACTGNLVAESLPATAGAEIDLVSSVMPSTVLAQLAQTDWPPYPGTNNHNITRGPGGYFSWIKMLLVVLVFLVWVRLADWLNRDAIKFSEHTGQHAEVWNPLMVVAFLGGLAAVFLIPAFMAGFPLFVALAFVPWTIYQLQRRGQIPDEARTGELFAEKITTSSSVPIDIKPAGSGDVAKANLIKARQLEQFEPACQILHDSVRNRVDQVLLDYTKDQVNHRIQVDGLWHQMPVLDRETGDGILWVLKIVGGLNPGERRHRQQGLFNLKVGREKVGCDLVTQGVKTGERVLMKLTREEGLQLELPNLGMDQATQDKILEMVEASGMVVVSSPPGQGLSTTWQSLLNSSDRFTRDFVGVGDFDERETERENVEIQRIDSRKNETPMSVLPTMALKEPNVFVMPEISDKKTMDFLTAQIAFDNRTVLTRLHAGSAVEAVLRLMTAAGNREQFIKGLSVVTCQRLVRKLCDQCKQPVQANPKAIQQMGGNPNVHKVLYKDYQLPPVEARIDAEGKPIEMEPCAACAGIGFQGRTAIFETLVLNQAIRDVLLKTPKIDQVSQVARQQGTLTLLQQAYRAVLEGRTSMPEVQRVFQPKR